MIVLEQPPRIYGKEDQIRLVLYLEDAMCNNHYSFRATLAEIERFVRASAPASHELPAEYPMEDFVEGHFTWGGQAFSLYYERSLGYMQFSSPVPAHIEALHSIVARHVRPTGLTTRSSEQAPAVGCFRTFTLDFAGACR